MKHATFLAGLVAVLAVSGVARASDRTGIYGLITGTSIERDAQSRPVRIRINGTFALAHVNAWPEYHPARTGYLYYRMVPGKETMVENEWLAIAAIGSGECVGIGSRRSTEHPQGVPLGTVRAASVPAANPDLYPIEGSAGLQNVPASSAMCQALKQARPSRR